jgi:hypothetical protein
MFESNPKAGRRDPVAGIFHSSQTSRCLLGSRQDRLVLKENKTKNGCAFGSRECNERGQPISVQPGEIAKTTRTKVIEESCQIRVPNMTAATATFQKTSTLP